MLLENDGVLPLSIDIGKLAVIGALADKENTGDFGSSRVNAPYVVTPLEGLMRLLGEDRIVHADGSSQSHLADAVEAADTIVAVVGYTADDEGEYIPGDLVPQMPETVKEAIPQENGERDPRGGDRSSLVLPQDQVELIEAAKESGKPVIVVVVAGSAVMVEEWRDGTNAILQTFYSGMEGGTALARLLFGEVSPSAKLPFTVARNAEDYPFFDRTATAITYDRWHGYTKFEHEEIQPRYAFGHGLSYTSFAYRALRAREVNDTIEIEVSVANTGDRASEEVVLAFAHLPGPKEDTPLRLLKGFTRVAIEPGQARPVTIPIAKDTLRRYDAKRREWYMPKGQYTFSVGDRSASVEL